MDDIRLKTDIRPLEGQQATDMLKQLRASTYVFNDLARTKHGFTSTEERIGLHAHDVAMVVPQAVHTAHFDADRRTGESLSGKNYLEIQYDKLVPLLVEALNEQADIIKRQGDAIRDLQRNIKDIV
jgi:trimeric autotransporter adhesin